MNFSKIFIGAGKRLIGLKSSRDGVEHFGTAVTTARFQIFGTTPEDSDSLKMIVRGSVRTWAAALYARITSKARLGTIFSHLVYIRH